jgi:diguanylate cyclase (GGDEF)-like protein
MTVTADAKSPMASLSGSPPVSHAHDRPASPRSALGPLTLARKVALIPALTLLLLGLILTVAVQMGARNTTALRALDRDVFEPLSRAQTLKDGVTLLHTRLFALLSIGNNESDPVAQKAGADALALRIDKETANFKQFLDMNPAASAPIASRLRAEFADYTARVRETASFAAYDASYGALVAGVTDDKFGHLRADLAALVQALAERRAELAADAVSNSLGARKMLLGLGLGAAILALLGSAVVGRSIARPVLRLTAMMNHLADGNTDLPVPGTDRRDEVGAMAHAVEVFRANLIARRQGEVILRRTNLQFDAALNSMLQGMIVWGPDHEVQLVNRRFYVITGIPADSIALGLTLGGVIDVMIAHGMFAGANPDTVCDKILVRLTARRSMQLELEMRPGLLVQIATEPMTNGGSVATFEDVTEKRQNEAQIIFMARHDALTGLPNRRLFQEHMAAMLDKGEEIQPFAVLCLDLDHFKEVNDTLGHPAGDELLRLVAARLRGCVRDHDLIARLGGDEFAIVVPSPTECATLAATLAARLVSSISAPYDLQGHNILIGTSIGIALSEPGVSGDDLLKRADVALYRAKEDRGTFAFFESGMDEQLQARLGMEADLRLALHRREFELNYQPLYNLIEDRVTAFEALIRWNSPTRGRVAPADFIPLAEQTGLIIAIGEWVLRTACAEAAPWPDHVRVAVNLSVIQTKNKNLVALVTEVLAETGLPARRLELEITESVLLQDTETIMTMLHNLHDMGVKVSMDDFGTGYSSLSYLRRFPFDKIKIDRSFVSDLRGMQIAAEDSGEAPDPLAVAAKSAATIVRAIVGLGVNLGISTTAEGVETAQQFAQIRQKGCTEVQGYFISPPRPANEVRELLGRLDASLPSIANSPNASPQRVA